MNFLQRLLVALAVLVPLACKSSAPEPQWQNDELSATSEHVLWEVTVLALEKEGYPVGSGLDPATLIATSGWKISLAPFKGKGWQAQAQVKYELAAPGRYKINVRVRRQLNQNLAKPLDLSYAEWEDAPDDTERALVLLQRIRSYLGNDIEISTDKARPPKK
jgi:hypothetical protein